MFNCNGNSLSEIDTIRFYAFIIELYYNLQNCKLIVVLKNYYIT